MTWARTGNNLVPFPVGLEPAGLDRLELHGTRNGGTIARRLRRLDIEHRLTTKVEENERGEEVTAETWEHVPPDGCEFKETTEGQAFGLVVEGSAEAPFPGLSVKAKDSAVEPAQWDGVRAVWVDTNGKEYEPQEFQIV